MVLLPLRLKTCSVLAVYCTLPLLMVEEVPLGVQLMGFEGGDEDFLPHLDLDHLRRENERNRREADIGVDEGRVAPVRFLPSVELGGQERLSLPTLLLLNEDCQWAQHG